MLLSVDRDAVSSALGLASIGTWLFAQSPQVYLNWKKGSVEGLALPFLVSWFLGDFTNFLGCVLTHQLPFQTWLAAYFILVDVVLCAQFAYYSRLRPVPQFPPLSEAFPYAQPSPHNSLAHGRRSRSRHGRSRSSRTRLVHSYGAESEEDPMLASWMTESSNASTATSPHHPARSLPSGTSTAASSDVTTVPPSPTLPERGRTLQRSALRVFDPTLTTIHGSPSSHPGFIHSGHMANHVAFVGEPTAENAAAAGPGRERQRTSSSRSRPPPPSRRSTSVVFLSVGALFTLGQLGSGGSFGTTDVDSGGRAWSSTSAVAPAQTLGWLAGDLRHPAIFFTSSSSNESPVAISAHARRATFPIDSASVSISKEAGDDDDRPLPPGYDWERVIGRTSAWMCTTAYLTSRLPQLWQNFRRRSVEGLSMTLFAAAFFGNSLYVASILTNPLAASASYLLESFPYLLGSGGTLCFDLMIIAQSWLYSEKRKARRDRDRRRRGTHGLNAEEEAALLAADEHDGASAHEVTYDDGLRGVHRSRSASTLGYGRSVSTSRSGRRTLSTSRGLRKGGSTELQPGGATMPTHSAVSSAGGMPGFHLDVDPEDEDGITDYGLTRSVSRGSSTRAPSRQPSFHAIQEEGESSVTLRAADV